MKSNILITGPRLLRDWAKAKSLFDGMDVNLICAQVEQCLSEKELLGLVGDIDGAICGGDKWTAKVFDAAPRLRALCKWGTGVDAIDLAAAKERGIAVKNCPDAFSVPVADHVFAMMLNFSRRISALDRAIKAGRWERIDGVSLAECSIGVIGVGNIGQTVLRRARAFGMTCYGCDPRMPSQQFLDDTGTKMVPMEALLRYSDFVSLNCDLNGTSHHLIGMQELKLMKKAGYLINTSRGPVVDEKALIRALESGTIAGAGLDVFEEEPPSLANPLRKMENVLLTPHLANSSERAAWAVHARAVENLKELLATTPLRGVKPRLVGAA